ncbi:hypothetical protein R6Z07F_001972 [Ovis aries]
MPEGKGLFLTRVHQAIFSLELIWPTGWALCSPPALTLFKDSRRKQVSAKGHEIVKIGVDPSVFLVQMDMDIQEEKEQRSTDICKIPWKATWYERKTLEVIVILPYTSSYEAKLSSMKEGATEISGSNCPAGARVATVSESNGTDYLVCLSDCKAGPALLRAVRRLSLAGSLLSRRLGDAMRFVARHVFKRVRAGHLLRKVAVFFKAGPTRDAGSISTTRLELSVLDITAVVITFTEDHNLPDALP